MTSGTLKLAPDYLLKPYSDLSKGLYRTMLKYYYNEGCSKQNDIIHFYYNYRGQDLTSDVLSREAALSCISQNKYTVYYYRDISRPDIYSLCQDIVF